MYNEERNLIIYNEAYKYLIDHADGLTSDILDTYLVSSKLDSLDQVFSVAVNFVVDWYKPKRKRLLYDDHNLSIIREILHEADLQYVCDTYSNAPSKLYDVMIERLVFNSTEDAFTQKVVKIYVNVVCGMAKYLSQFKDIKSMYDYFEQYQICKEKIMLLREIMAASKQLCYKHENCNNEGWGFALASNWLKDIGMHDYCKPDVHVKAFSKELKVSESKSDEAVFKAFVAMADSAKRLDPTVNAFKADRLAYLIGSGDFFNHYGIISYHGSTSDFAKEVLSKF